MANVESISESHRPHHVPPPTLAQLADQRGWLSLSADGIVRCPLLVKGKLVDAPIVDPNSIAAAFAAVDRGRASSDPYDSYARVGNAQVLRHAEIDRKTMRVTGRWIYSVMPSIDAMALVEPDLEQLDELYSMPYASVLEWLRVVRAALERETELVGRVRELDRRSSEHPDAFVDAAFMAFAVLLDPQHAVDAVDGELAHHGISGRRLLDEWVPLAGACRPGPVHLVGSDLVPQALWDQMQAHAVELRAMPTRQLHITAGNSPIIPLLSLLRAIWTKSPCALKLPSGAALPGSMLAFIAANAAPDHPLTRHLSMVYWQGGDDMVERVLLSPGAFDRIVVWGAPDAVASVRARARFTKTLCFNPRYGASFIGREAFYGDLDDVAARAVCDTMIENQKACIASLVHYVEGSVEDAERYADAVARVLARWDERSPHPLLDRHRGQLRRLERGMLLDAQVRYHEVEGEYRSGVIVAPHEIAIKDHPMCRLVIVRPVAHLDDCLHFLHAGVATVGVYPEARRLALRDRIGARGVSNIVPLGQSSCAAIGMAHDGMIVLSELVDWKNS